MIESARTGRERYGLALILILAAMVFIMAAPVSNWTRVIVLALEGAALIASLRAADADRRLRLGCSVLVGLALIGGIVQSIGTENADPFFVSFIILLLVVLAAPVIALGLIRQMRDVKRVTIHTMLGVLCIYLLMALAFAAAFAVIEAASGDPFFRAGQGSETLSNYLYFSITTITTAGLGDFSPADDLGRSLTGVEALVGQIYLVTVVAVIVANLSRRS